MNDMSSMNYLLWGVFPYVAITLFFLVPFLRMAYRPFGLTTRPSGIFRGRGVLGLAAHLLHWGIFLAFFGHIAGLMGGILGWGSWIAAFFWLGTIGGIAAMSGSILALTRRALVPEMRAMSQTDDYVVHFFLIAILGVAMYQAIFDRIWGVSYTVAPWFASLWRFQPQPELMASASVLTKTHVFLAFAFAAYFPFTKLIHAWTLPVNYLVRPYQVMRTAARVFQNSWEFRLVTDKSYMTYLALGVFVLLLSIAFVLPGPTTKGFLQASAARSPSDEPLAAAPRSVLEGYPLYVSQCARCHGLTGQGDGPGARSPTFTSVPRNLAAGQFRFISTANGVASNDDLRRVVLNGLNGSGMPAFNQLSESQVQSIVAVLGFLWKDRPDRAEPIAVPPRPAASAAMIAAGKDLFANNCVVCHGTAGRGDGMLAGSIRDSFGNLVRPHNLVADPLKGGASPTQLYYRLAAGIPGGNGGWLMPRFGELGPEKLWALISYLETEILPQRKLAEATSAQ